MNYIIAQFIPIIVLFFIIAYPRQSGFCANTILGKLLFISIILFFTNLDIILGIFVCSLVILYYQSDFVENMLNMEGMSNYQESTSKVDDFRQENCHDNVLKYKDMTVKNDMAEHVFPEMSFNYDTCNPCNSSCSFSVIQHKLVTENEIVRGAKDTRLFVFE